MRKITSLLMCTLFLASMLIPSLNIVPARANGTIYIRADGSINPPTANITSMDNITYTFTDNNYDEIVVERDNIVIDGTGYTLQGTESGIGIDLTGRSNVTIMSTEIKSFEYGIQLDGSLNNTISGNNITENQWCGIYLRDSSNNNHISGNNITANKNVGIEICIFSNNNTISGNNITENQWCGILLHWSSNTISGNNIANNDEGIILTDSSNNTISGNNITANDDFGITLYGGADYNTISGNDITANNEYGIRLF